MRKETKISIRNHERTNEKGGVMHEIKNYDNWKLQAPNETFDDKCSECGYEHEIADMHEVKDDIYVCCDCWIEVKGLQSLSEKSAYEITSEMIDKQIRGLK